jgi:hypothetical protein
MQNTTETGQSRRLLMEQAAPKRMTKSQLRGEKLSFAVEVFPPTFSAA